LGKKRQAAKSRLFLCPQKRRRPKFRKILNRRDLQWPINKTKNLARIASRNLLKINMLAGNPRPRGVNRLFFALSAAFADRLAYRLL